MNPNDDPCVGIDVGRTGDKTVLAFRRGSVLTNIVELPLSDLMTTTGRIVREVEGRGFRPGVKGVPFFHEAQPARGKIVVDAPGLGYAILDRLTELGFDTVGFNGGGSPGLFVKDKFLNCRAQAFWALREGLEAGQIMLPKDEVLFEELLAHSWRPTSAGKIQIRPKDEIRNAIGRSPDRADAVVLAFWAKARCSRGGMLVTL